MFSFSTSFEIPINDNSTDYNPDENNLCIFPDGSGGKNVNGTCIPFYDVPDYNSTEYDPYDFGPEVDPSCCVDEPECTKTGQFINEVCVSDLFCCIDNESCYDPSCCPWKDYRGELVDGLCETQEGFNCVTKDGYLGKYDAGYDCVSDLKPPTTYEPGFYA